MKGEVARRRLPAKVFCLKCWSRCSSLPASRALAHFTCAHPLIHTHTRTHARTHHSANAASKLRAHTDLHTHEHESDQRVQGPMPKKLPHTNTKTSKHAYMETHSSTNLTR